MNIPSISSTAPSFKTSDESTPSIASTKGTTQSTAQSTAQSTPAKSVDKLALPSESAISDAVKRSNDALQTSSQGIEFNFNPELNVNVVKVIDQKTKEVLRQIPSIEMLEIAKALDSFQQGAMINVKV